MELYNNPKNLFVAGFIGSPAMNFMPATLDGDTLKLPMADVRLPRGDLRGHRQAAATAPDRGHPPGGLRGRLARGRRPGPRRRPSRLHIEVVESMGSELYAHFSVVPRSRSSRRSCASWRRIGRRRGAGRGRGRARWSRASTRPRRSARAGGGALGRRHPVKLFDPDGRRPRRRRTAAPRTGSEVRDGRREALSGNARVAQPLEHLVVPVVGAQQQPAQFATRRYARSRCPCRSAGLASISTTGRYSRGTTLRPPPRASSARPRPASRESPRPRRPPPGGVCRALVREPDALPRLREAARARRRAARGSSAAGRPADPLLGSTSVTTSVTYASILSCPIARATDTRWCPSLTKCRSPIR